MNRQLRFKTLVPTACINLLIAQGILLAEEPAMPVEAPIASLPAVPGLEVRTFQIGPKSLNGLIYLPEGYAASQENWPLMIFLHGAGQRGTDTEKLKKNGPILLITKGRKFPLIIAAPQCPTDGYWSKPEQVTQLRCVLDSLLRDYRIDGSRVYLTGLSMGAHGVWSFASTYPDLFAAIAPIAGGGDCSHADRLAKMPIWAFHGDADDNVPFKQTEDMVAALRKAGAGDNLRFTGYPGVKHDSWTATYDNDELYTWLFSQRKQADASTLSR